MKYGGKMNIFSLFKNTFKSFNEDYWENGLSEFSSKAFFNTEEDKCYPKVDAFIKDDKLNINIAVPGLKKEDIEITVLNDTLKIKGTSKSKNTNELISELHHCSFERILKFDYFISDNVQATMNDGILSIICEVDKTKNQAKKVNIN